MATPKPFNADLYWGNVTGAELLDDGRYLVKTNKGDGGSPGSLQINPKTGEIMYGNAYENGQDYWKTEDYSGTKDYGLGGSSGGVIVTKRDATGTPVEFYAGTPGGGGKITTDLAEAQALAQGYQSWWDEQNPEKAKYAQQEAMRAQAANTAGSVASRSSIPGGSPTPTSASSTPSSAGALATPGTGEDWFKKHASEWDQPTQSEQTWNGLSGGFNQPSNAETLWGQYAPTFSSPSGLEDIYNRKSKEARTNLNRRASSAGIADSGAAARATGNLDQKFADQYVGALQGWGQTGMGLAATADTAKLTREGKAMDWAGDADAGRFTRLTGGQNAANQAQNLMEGRGAQSFDAALKLGGASAGIAGSGLQAASQEKLATDMGVLQAEVQKGNLDAASATAQAQEMMASFGIVMSALQMSQLKTAFQNPSSAQSQMTFKQLLGLGVTQ